MKNQLQATKSRFTLPPVPKELVNGTEQYRKQRLSAFIFKCIVTGLTILSAIFALFVPTLELATGDLWSEGIDKTYAVSSINALSYILNGMSEDEDEYLTSLIATKAIKSESDETVYSRLSETQVIEDAEYRRSAYYTPFTRASYVNVFFGITAKNNASAMTTKSNAVRAYNEYIDFLDERLDYYRNLDLTSSIEYTYYRAYYNNASTNEYKIKNACQNLISQTQTQIFKLFTEDIERGNLDGIYYFIKSVKNSDWEVDDFGNLKETAANKELFTSLTEKYLTGNYKWSTQLLENTAMICTESPLAEIIITDNELENIICPTYTGNIEYITFTSAQYSFADSSCSTLELYGNDLGLFAIPIAALGLAECALLVIFSIAPLVSVLINIRPGKEMGKAKKSLVFTTVIGFIITAYMAILSVSLSSTYIFLFCIGTGLVLSALVLVAKTICMIIYCKLFNKALKTYQTYFGA